MSNLPPGVTVGMIPGNRPEDMAWETAMERLEESGLEPREIADRLGILEDDDEDRVMDWDWLADRICDRGLEAEDMKL